MKINFKIGSEQINDTVEKVTKIGKKTAEVTTNVAKSLVNKIQEENLKARIKKYNPVFPDEYNKSDFGVSNLIMIVDDVIRKDVDVCEGAIGWKTTQKGVEIFVLYDEAVKSSGLHFVPAAVCDSVYYVDVHDRTRFVRLDSYFENMQQSKLAELQHIAYSLGAKEYRVEMYDTSSEKRSVEQKGSLNKKTISDKINASEESKVTIEKETRRESVAFAEFTGDKKPTHPQLCWFAHDKNIKNLINMRCSGDSNSEVKTYNIELKGTDIASMGVSTAVKIDAAINKLGIGSSINLQNKAMEEHHHKMSFKLKFQ